MKLNKWLDRRIGFMTGSLVIMLGTIVPAVVPAFASAASLDSRSIAMSTSLPDATGVKYHLQATIHTPIPTTGGVIIQFCSDSPLIGLACTAPDGLDVSGATADSGTVNSTLTTSSVIEWQPASTVTGTLNVEFSGITNPSSPTSAGGNDTFYARVTTYTGASVDWTNATTVGSDTDSGGIAMSVANNLNVKAYVQEALTFCVSHTAPTDAKCTGADDPSMTLGEQTGSVKVLGTTTSTGDDYAQVDTNAAHGAVVNLKTDTAGCGGLVRANDTPGNCDIKPQTSAASTLDNSSFGHFGLKEGPAAAVASANIGEVPAVSGTYSSTNWFLDYVAGDASGITSTYGSPLFSVAGPTGGYNMPFTLGAIAAATTPAGIYSANLTMVATGTF